MSTIADLRKLVKGDVITPGDRDYALAIRRWACNAERKAAIVVFVKDEADVTTALSYAKEHRLPIAIRGGGHNPVGASSVEGGLVIDLSRYVNNVRIDAARKLAYVGGGALWDAVDKAAIKHGLATVGGTINHTGVGGLVLGGGFGWLSGEHGMAVDNLVQVTLVSADGSVHTASERENPDLFFGVRGAGCNFGVVTEFVLTLHPQRRTVFSGTVIFRADALKEIVKMAKEWYPTIGPKEGLNMLLTSKRDDRTPIIACIIFFNGTEAEGRARFKKLYDIGPMMDLAREVPYEELNGMQNAGLETGNGVYWKGLAHEGPDYGMLAKVQAKIIPVQQAGKFNADVVFEWLPLGKIQSVPSSKAAVRRFANPNCLINVGWAGSSDSPDRAREARQLGQEIAVIVAGGQSELKDKKSVGYTNYDQEGVAGVDEVKDKAKVSFGENYPALQRIKKKYDPENIFDKWFAITPA